VELYFQWVQQIHARLEPLFSDRNREACMKQCIQEIESFLESGSFEQFTLFLSLSYLFYMPYVTLLLNRYFQQKLRNQSVPNLYAMFGISMPTASEIREELLGTCSSDFHSVLL